MSTGVVIRLKNLPNSAGTTDIRRFFGGLSIPDGGVHIIGGDDGTAFILFSTDEDARRAMLLDSQKITGEKIKLMLSSHTEMRTMIEESQRKYEELRGLRPPEPPITNLTNRSSATGGNANKSQAVEVDVNDLYVELKGMPENVTEEDLVEFFRNLPISAIRLLLDEGGQQTGQGFVRFRSATSKLSALKKDRDFLGPRFVRVLPATEKQWIVASSQMCEVWRPNSDHQSRKRGANNTPSNEGTPKRSRAFSPIRYENCVELRGLPPSASEKTVRDLFYHLQFAENGLYIESDGKACRGRAFAEFTSLDDYKEALLKDGEILEEKQIRVINISRQGMAECIKHNKKYLKMKREEEYKREREELERKAREKRQLKEAHERQQQLEEQKRTEEQRKRREHHLKKQKEMEEWLARQHEKEEAERKRQELEKRMEEERRIRAAEEDRARREEERRRRQEEEQMRREEEERRRREYERKRQRELDELELRIKEEEKRRIQEELLKEELESMNNGNVKEVEMDIESPPKVDDLSDHYPPPPSDALLPANPALARYSVAAGKDSDYSSYDRNSMIDHGPRPDEPRNPYVAVPYSRGRSPPPITSAAEHRDRPPPIPPHVIPGIPPPLPAGMVGAAQPPRIPPSIPPPPLPPAIPVLRIPPRPQIPVVRDPMYPPPVTPPVKPPMPVVPVVQANIVPSPALPPPAVVLPPPNSAPPEPAAETNHSTPSVFCRVANAPFTATEAELIDFFKGCQIAPNGVEFLTKHGKASGHIFVKFATEKDATEAAKLDQNTFGGREILVRLTHVTQMSDILRKFDTRKFGELFPNKVGGKLPSKDSLDLERDIFHERMTCVRIANLPTNTIVEDILHAFSGIGILPNGVHILKMADGKCNGSAFVEVITPEDCVRATNLHAVASVQGSLIRVMPLKQLDMDREINDHNSTVFGRFPSGPPPGIPHHLPPVRGRIPVPPPPIPTPPGMQHPPPPVRPDHEFGPRHPDYRLPLRPPLPPRGRSPPPHMKNHRPSSPGRGPPQSRPRSPPRGPSGRPISPPMRPRSPREMSRGEMAQRADMDQLNRRIEHERSKMREMRPPGPYGDHFPLPGPRPHFDRPGERPHFPPGLPPRFPPRFMGDGPWRARYPLDMPRFRLPHGTVALKMSNLSFHITQEDILEFFIKCSPLPDSVRLMYNPAGKLTGEGFIAFPSREAAERALRELDQKPLLQRNIKLSFA